jgi:DnaJ-domain-containing protein 1
MDGETWLVLAFFAGIVIVTFKLLRNPAYKPFSRVAALIGALVLIAQIDDRKTAQAFGATVMLGALAAGVVAIATRSGSWSARVNGWRRRRHTEADDHERDSLGLARQAVQAERDALRREEIEARARIAREQAELEEAARESRRRIEAEVKTAQAHIAAEREKLRREQETALKAKEPDPYEVLGLPRTATKEEIKRRYRQLVAAYHPDKAAGATPEIRQLAEEKIKEINAAYEKVR